MLKKSFKKRFIKKAAPFALTAVITASLMTYALPGNRVCAETDEYDVALQMDNSGNLLDYTAYQRAYGGENRSEDTIILTAQNILGTAERYNDYEGRKGEAIYTDENSSVEFSFEVAECGLYNILFEYYPIEGNGGTIERALYIDGKAPFSETENLSFSRIWSNAPGEIKEDTQGNQIMIEQTETPRWTTQYATDPSGIASDPLAFYKEELKTLAYALGQIQGTGTAGVNIARAGVGAAVSVFMMIIPILIFVFSQSNIIETMSSSGMKD